ncbi:hypothetical protein [Cellvibrio japonicus]|uniref:Uncharacterized protein n=1 Tax=Cellvibrio japonicus (strain Ueda107) TaxID=498211 RepID=B3PID4_CELJU|nr:hypothetical protein [Cellvibrio japonicus]ACE84706.1 conserved hypothetical protein [Cellvibrio japonicus Ueda107]QEI12535.1 hypothetical protein FY117_10070 [Cellvibrio japonicus]QEI16109.1 hypothetical protein FY116_10075 [Cellvibrio japonicus]QEI19687.1 hypothetical protein FY115_10070 [Cellvibrio japonicus]
MINHAAELQEYVIRPCLKHLGIEDPAMELLLLGTAARESSQGFQCCCPVSGGLGLYHITPERHQQVWDQILIRSPDMASNVRGLASQQGFLKAPHQELVTNLLYATAIAWAIYWGANVSSADLKDVTAMANTWARDFDNGSRQQDGNYSVASFLHSYRKWILRDKRMRAA